MSQLSGVILSSLMTISPELPTHATSYDGVSRDISRFYELNAPVIVGEGEYFKDDYSIPFAFNTGIHTDKLDTGFVSIGYTQHIPMDYNHTLSIGYAADVSYTNHKPCTDSFGKEYFCANLTSWKEFERKTNVEINHSINITYRISF